MVSDILPDIVSSRPARPHRRRRIAKKWLKRFGQVHVRKPVCLELSEGLLGGRKLICNQLYLDQLNLASMDQILIDRIKSGTEKLIANAPKIKKDWEDFKNYIKSVKQKEEYEKFKNQHKDFMEQQGAKI